METMVIPIKFFKNGITTTTKITLANIIIRHIIREKEIMTKMTMLSEGFVRITIGNEKEFKNEVKENGNNQN